MKLKTIAFSKEKPDRFAKKQFLQKATLNMYHHKCELQVAVRCSCTRECVRGWEDACLRVGLQLQRQIAARLPECPVPGEPWLCPSLL